MKGPVSTSETNGSEQVPNDFPEDLAAAEQSSLASEPLEEVKVDPNGDGKPDRTQAGMSVEEYEAMLDAEQDGGFLEGGDIAGAVHQDA